MANELKLFSFTSSGFVIIAAGFNRGHAVKQIAKYLEDKGFELHVSQAVQEIKLASESKKGGLLVLQEQIRGL
jgi:hypothetical protein